MADGFKESFRYASIVIDREVNRTTRLARTQIGKLYPQILEAATLITTTKMNEKEQGLLPQSACVVIRKEAAEKEGEEERVVGIMLENGSPLRPGKMLKENGSLVMVTFGTREEAGEISGQEYIDSTRRLLGGLVVGTEIAEKAQERIDEEARRAAERDARKAAAQEPKVETAELG